MKGYIMKLEDKNKIINKLTGSIAQTDPYFHMQIDDFLPLDLAKKLTNDFLSYDDEKWFCYFNKIEDKKLLSDWRQFPKETYQFFSFLNSPLMLETLSNMVGMQLYPDHGLHGGGWHIHASGGKLNPHLDYSLHPQLGLQRKLNLIIYLCEDWDKSYGGDFGMWNSNPDGTASKLHKEISMGFNKAVLFDTTQNSWHGMSKPVTCPEGKYRKSLAIYYLTEPVGDVDTRSRALFTPTEEQIGDTEIQELIAKRSDIKTATEVYVNE
jgi:Rps23 Pro-64 3,4-dihydroxylase Tpa1-like proline 4-hydroxylase